MRRRRAPAATGSGARAGRRQTPRRSRKQEKWFNIEARGRGFRDIDDLTARDIALFETLPELWRKKHPAEALLSRGGVTQTAAFKRWFGDSKVVDDEGRPLVVYHGTNKGIWSFEPKRGAMWFAEDQGLANSFVGGGRQSIGKMPGKGAAAYPVYLRITNSLDLTDLSFGETVSMSEILRLAGAWVPEVAMWRLRSRRALGLQSTAPTAHRRGHTWTPPVCKALLRCRQEGKGWGSCGAQVSSTILSGDGVGRAYRVRVSIVSGS